jgi:hypothetical protein
VCVNPRGGSQFWRGIHEAKDTCLKGLKYIVGDGKKMRFRLDVWLGECPLKLRFSKLFQISLCKNWVVAQVLEGGGINLDFRRNLEEEDRLEWEELMECLSGIHLGSNTDTIKWCLTSNGQFSIASLYLHCAFSGVVDTRMEEMWTTKIPLKVKNFVWLVYQGRIQTADNLIRKQWKGDKKCKLCEDEESVNHFLFLYPIASYMWCIIRDTLQWEQSLRSMKDFNDVFLLERGIKGMGRCFSCLVQCVGHYG